jgi:hypothetical protein
VPTEANGWRSIVRRSIARLVPHPGQNTSSHGVPASSAALIVGDHSMSRPVARRRYQRSDYSLRLGARGPVGLELGGASIDVDTLYSDAHRGSIGARAAEVDPTIRGAVAPNSRSGAAREQHARSRGRHLGATLTPTRLTVGERRNQRPVTVAGPLTHP